MQVNSQEQIPSPNESMDIVSVLLIEHRLLRELMDTMGNWLAEGLLAEAVRERAAVLACALDVHAQREEEELFAPMLARSALARHLIELMEIVHDEVRALYEEIKTAIDPGSKVWTIIEMTEAHFDREEQELFPLAETLLLPAERQVPVPSSSDAAQAPR